MIKPVHLITSPKLNELTLELLDRVIESGVLEVESIDELDRELAVIVAFGESVVYDENVYLEECFETTEQLEAVEQFLEHQGASMFSIQALFDHVRYLNSRIVDGVLEGLGL